jgi:hypothetical protein
MLLDSRARALIVSRSLLTLFKPLLCRSHLVIEFARIRT